ncbi:MAG TPA: PQQ-binding-like beta-propeller repeat protein, partial [Terriglobia bacterium]|nr:PQQ-binding-like beta-propeller repeat protein [Terriglobia bacterium]
MRSRLSRFRNHARAVVLLSTLAPVNLTAQTSSAWPQFGGPLRNFNSPSKGLANTWPAEGPHKVWSRPLGEGYSGIAVDAGKLYTMYRVSAAQAGSKFDREVIVALDAQTGKTLWEDQYDAPFEPGMKMENGPGPHVTPLLVGNQVYTVGITGKFYCKDKSTGKTLWYHDLMKEYQAPRRDRGYSCSPVAYKQTVILPVGGPGQAVMAFNQKDGTVAWKKHD